MRSRQGASPATARPPAAGSPADLPPLARSVAAWLLLATFALEFWLFDAVGAARFTSLYPRWNDQVQYLRESYVAYEYARAHGFFAGLWHALTNHSAQGTLHDFFAVVAFTLAGPSRSAALALNLLALIAWQASLFLATVRASRQPPLAFAIALLPLLLFGPWSDVPGSAYDFRLDQFAFCALGVSACALWLSDRFRSRLGSLAFGAAVGLTLLTRFLTGTYLVVVFAAALVWVIAAQDRRQRLLNLVLAASVAALLAGPVFWSSLGAIRDYYWVGHYVGPESTIRDPRLSVVGSLGFIGHHVLHRHLGPAILLAVGIGATALACLRREPLRPAGSQPWFVGILFLTAPALILTLHRQKSEVAVSALLPGVVLLFAALWLFAARRASAFQLRVFAATTALVALGFFVQAQRHPPVSPAALADTRRVNSLADEVVRRARTAGLPVVRLAVDHITDALDAPVLQIVSYERQRTWVAFEKTLPITIEPPTEEFVFSRLRESDFVVLTLDGPAGTYPYDHRLTELRARTRAWCDTHLHLANDFALFGRRLVLYQRRELPFP